MSAGLQGFDWSLLAAPFVAGLLVLATHVPLGAEVLRRGIIFPFSFFPFHSSLGC